MDGVAELARMFSKEKEERRSTTEAIVQRVDDDGTIWASVPGGAGEFPVARSHVDASVGDTVTVEVSGGRATVTGSTSAPSISAARASELMSPIADAASQASAMASSATASAAAAAEAATRAEATANGIEALARAAQTDAATAKTAATEAKDDASSAATSAQEAQASALSAELGLSRVVDVVGVLDWVSAHRKPTDDEAPEPGKSYYELDDDGGHVRLVEEVPATYAATEDATAQDGKVYYVAADGGYAPASTEPTYSATSDASPADGKTYYEESRGGYEPTADASPVDGKSYFTYAEGAYVAADVSGGFDPAVEYYRADEGGYAIVAQVAEPEDGASYYVAEGGGYALADVSGGFSRGVQYYVLEAGGYVEVETSDPDTGEACTPLDGQDYYVDDGAGGYALADVSGGFLEGVAYYALLPDAYVEIETEFPPEDGVDYFTWSEGGYSPADVSSGFRDGETYYESVGAGALVEADVSEGFGDGTYYEAVPCDPAARGYLEMYAEGNPRALGYYELDDAVAAYVGAHLALADSGLDLMLDESGYRVHIGTVDGSYPMGVYILGADGLPAGFYGERSQVGRTDAMHIEMGEDGLYFMQGDDREDAVAYIKVEDGASTFYMTRSVVVDDMMLGDGLWKFYRRDNRNLALKWIGGE